MGQTEGRSAQDTKDLILHAAVAVIRRDGLAATLEDIAAEAGVSKGGLVYHYRSKQALLLALGEWLAQTFVNQVSEHRDPDDTAPGSLTRAYIRASFATVGDPNTARDNLALAAHLMSDSELQPLADEDGRRWRDQLDQDGLPTATTTLVIAACDGVGTGHLWGSSLRPTDTDDLRDLLLNLTHQPLDRPAPRV